MERLHQCPDLSQRLERELSSLRLPTVTQGESHRVITRIAQALGINPAVSNLFVLREPLTIPEYVLFVRERVAEFAPVDIQATLEQAEAALLDDNPGPRSFDSMASQLSQWQRNNQAATFTRVAEVSDDEDETASSDGEDAVSSDEDTVLPPRNDNDSSEDEEEAQAAPVTEESATALCERLLQDPMKLSEFTRQLYDLVNTRGDCKIDLSQIQPFLDYLINHNFEPILLRKVINDLAAREFAQIRELNYVKFCVFVRYVLQRYSA